MIDFDFMQKYVAAMEKAAKQAGYASITGQEVQEITLNTNNAKKLGEIVGYSLVELLAKCRVIIDDSMTDGQVIFTFK